MPYKDKSRQRAAQRKWYAENKDRKRAYAQRPEVKDRQRAARTDIACLKRRLELDDSGIRAILADVDAGRRYIDIAADWLIEEGDVSAIALAHGIRRRQRRQIQHKPEARP